MKIRVFNHIYPIWPVIHFAKNKISKISKIAGFNWQTFYFHLSPGSWFQYISGCMYSNERYGKNVNLMFLA